MDPIDSLLEQAVKNSTIAGCAYLAKTADGNATFTGAFGTTSLRPDAPPIRTNSVFSLVSATKLLTAIAALQLVERGALTLDQDVSTLLPELAAQPIWTGTTTTTTTTAAGDDDDDNNNNNTGTPVLRPRRNPLTLRHLLTHSAGLPYPGFAALPPGYGAQLMSRMQAGTRTVAARFGGPLAFEPGTGFGYGAGMDWVGVIVERVCGKPLDAVMREGIWEPLGIDGITFWPDRDAAIAARRVERVERAGDGGVRAASTPSINEGLEECFGGQGAYADLEDYAAVLAALLAPRDERLLKRETVALMFRPQLSPESKRALNEMLREPKMTAQLLGDFVEPKSYDWNLAGLMVDADGADGGKTCWFGMENVYWLIDFHAGICGVFGTQLLPMGDRKVNELVVAWEKAMYRGLLQ